MVSVIYNTLLLRGRGHFSAWSTYPRYVEFLGGMVRVRHVAAATSPQYIFRLMAKRLRWEPDREQLGCDLSAARRLVIGRGEVVHLLYGDADLFYAGRWRAVGHLRGNRLACTFHFPQSVLESRPLDFDHIDAAVALGSQHAAYLRSKLGSGQVFRASHGVDIRAWHPAESRRSSTPTCVCVGNWLRDFSTLEQVIQLVASEEPATRFEIVASQLDVFQPKAYEALVALPNVYLHLEKLPDVALRNIYQSAWVHILPLTDAVANNALLEGMACGLPTVTTAVGDVLDYTTDRGAICVAPGNQNRMAEAVLGLLGDHQRREKLGQMGREVAETVRLEAVARQHADIYCKIANRRQFGFGAKLRSFAA